jgi:tetratricopeptide (TPR) repeat protein
MKEKWRVLAVALWCVGTLYARTAAEADWRKEILEVDRLRQQGAYVQAQKQSVRLVREVQYSGAEGHDLAAALNTLALVDADLGDFGTAEHLLLRAKRIWERAGDEYRLPLSQCVSNLASIYLESGEWGKAERLLLGRISAPARTTDPSEARLVHLLAALYYERGRYREAMPLEEQAIQLWQTRAGPQDPALAAMLNTLALLYTRAGRTGEALSHFERSLEILSKNSDPVLMAKVLVSVSTIHARAGRYADARVMICRARAIVEETLGQRSPLLLAVLTNEALVLRKLGRNAEAKVAHERAKSIQEMLAHDGKAPYTVDVIELARDR